MVEPFFVFGTENFINYLYYYTYVFTVDMKNK